MLGLGYQDVNKYLKQKYLKYFREYLKIYFQANLKYLS
jgi:hypothetical protein